jgi:hypothetical protein
VRNECTPTFYERFEVASCAKSRISSMRCSTIVRRPTLHDATEATRIALALRESLQSRR